MYQVYAEKLDGMRNPAGLTDPRPAFSWRLRSDAHDVAQTAYRVVVTSAADGRVVWDSGMLESSDVHGVPYGGLPLSADTDYTWNVTSVATSGEESTGKEQHFSTGITDAALWQAHWIEATEPRKPLGDCTDTATIMQGLVVNPDDREDALNPCLYFRKTIELEGGVRRATAYATAHGIYELRVNGRRYGAPFAPGYSVYAKHLECQRYDVTEALRPGTNALAAVVADGWYTGKVGLMGIGEQYGTSNAFLLQVFVEFDDGSSEVVCSDRDFKWATGGYRYADLFVGEKFDAGGEPEGYSLPGYDDSSWSPVAVRDYGYARLTGPASEPVHILREQAPKALLHTPAGEMVLDAGENVVGYVRARIGGAKGHRVMFEYSETLDGHGDFFDNLKRPGQNKDQRDIYVFARDGQEEYSPTFTFHGFQYVRITGAPEAQLTDFTVVVIGTDLEKTGSFACSDERLNRLQQNIFRSQQGNMLSVPTDCPHREKAGWTGDMQVYAPTACFNMDVEAFLRRWLYDMRLEQLPNGQIPHVIPTIPSDGYITQSANASSAGWADACVIVPYRLYQAYGDPGILRENYSMMLRWMDYVQTMAPTGLWNTGFHFGDWLVPSLLGNGGPMMGAEMTKTPVATAMFANSAALMSQIASALGDSSRQAHFRELEAHIMQAFATEYVKDDGSLAVNLQGIYVLALQMGLVPETLRPAAVGHLVRLIDENGGCLDTGFLSVPFLLDVLYDNGQPDVAFKLLFQTKRPSWLYEVGWGATTMWESWNNIAEDGTRHYQSYNHFAFGCVGDFIYRRILGLQRIAPGYREVRIAPDPRCGLSSASGSLETVYGKVAVDWKLEGGEAFVRAEIPPSVTAELAIEPRPVTVGSGTHEFRLPAPKATV